MHVETETPEKESSAISRFDARMEQSGMKERMFTETDNILAKSSWQERLEEAVQSKC